MRRFLTMDTQPDTGGEIVDALQQRVWRRRGNLRAAVLRYVGGGRLGLPEEVEQQGGRDGMGAATAYSVCDRPV